MVLLISFIGLLIGSAINALVWRFHEGLSWTKGNSMCTKCHHRLFAIDLVPVLSWVALGGKCRYCQSKISKEYPVVELLTAFLFGLSAYTIHANSPFEQITFVIWLILLVFLIILAVYDLKWMLLPNRIIFPAIIIALAQLLLFIVLDLPFHTYLGPIIGAVIFGGIFWILANIAKGKLMGGGDVKLVFLMGLILGIQKLLLALFISFNAAALIGIILIILGKKKRTGYIPFGPFLILGTIIAYLWGRIIIEFYLNLTIK